MPKFKIDATLYEPVTVEVEGGRTYESAPLSPALFRETDKMLAKKKAGEITDMDFIIGQFALIFGITEDEAGKLDSRVINASLNHVTETMNSQIKAKVPDGTTVEATAEKNVQKPGDETSPS